jgi:hypothetical protein
LGYLGVFWAILTARVLAALCFFFIPGRLFPLIQQVLPNRPFEVKKLITRMLLDMNVMNIAEHMMENKSIVRSIAQQGKV